MKKIKTKNEKNTEERKMTKLETTLTADLINKTPEKINCARWRTELVTPAQFREHVIGLGGAFAVGVYTDARRRVENFISSSLIGLDFDDGKHTLEGLLNHPLIGAHAGLVYASPSHTPEKPKWRVVFFLENPITEKNRYADCVKRVIAKIGADLEGLDHVAKDCARLFFGHALPVSDEGSRWYANDHARLPMVVLDSLPRATTATTNIVTGERGLSAKNTSKNGVTAKNTPEIGVSAVISAEEFAKLTAKLPVRARNALKKLIIAKKNRNNVLYATARCFNDCLVKNDTAYRILHRACVLNGYIAKDGVRSFDSSFLSAYGNLPSPVFVGDEDEDIGFFNSLPIEDEFGKTENTLRVAYPYVTQMSNDELTHILTHRLVMVKSPTGTGKSTLQSKIIEFWEKKLGVTPKVLVVTHRRALVREIAHKLGFITYAEMTNPSLKGVTLVNTSHVTTFDSLWRYEGARFDLVFIDEGVQALEHLTSSSTLKKDRITPQRVLEDVMRFARQTAVFDANFTHGTANWLENVLTAHTHSSIRVVNSTRPSSRPLDIWHERSAFLARVFETARAGFTTLACTSIADARIVNRLATDTGLRTVLVCSDNSDHEAVKEKIANINTLVGTDLLIYTPSLGTGIDITRPVKGAYLMARPRPLSGDDLVQMLSRSRHAEAYGAYGVVSAGDDFTPAPADVILTDLLQITRAELGTLPDNKNFDYLTSARLFSTLRAEKEKLFADKHAFVKSAIANGFTFRMSYKNGRDKNIASAFFDAIEADKQWRRATTLAIEPLSDEDLENLRKNGNMSYSAKMANLRWHIEFMTGVNIDEWAYDALRTPEKQARASRAADVLADDAEAKLENKKINAGRAYQDVRARNVQRNLFLDLITILGFGTIAELNGLQNLARTELVTPAVEAWLARNQNLIRQAFARYRQTDNPVTELRAFLRAYGIKLTSKQVRRGDDFVMVYSIDTSSLEEVLRLASVVLTATRARARARVENAKKPVTAKTIHPPHAPSKKPERGVFNPFSKTADVSKRL